MYITQHPHTLSLNCSAGIDSKDLDSEFFAKSDFVVSTLPGTKATHKIIGKHQFAAMLPSAVFIR